MIGRSTSPSIRNRMSPVITLSDKDQRKTGVCRKECDNACIVTQGGLLGASSPVNPLRATHAGATIVAEVAIAIAYGDRSAVVATGGVALKTGELRVATGGPVVRIDLHRHAGAIEHVKVHRLAVSGGSVAVGRRSNNRPRCRQQESWFRSPTRLPAPRHRSCRASKPLLASRYPGRNVIPSHRKDIVNDALGDTDIGIRRVSHGVESRVRELVDEHFQRHAVLQAHRDRPYQRRP